MNQQTPRDLVTALRARIRVPDRNDSSLHALEQLRNGFSQAVAFENLTVLSDACVSLTPVDILTKLAHKRGGYCFELNTAFAALLESQGLESQMHLGRVWLRNPKQVPPRNHCSNVIEIDGRRYIADVGFGGRAPRCLVPLFDFGTEIDDGDIPGEPIRAIEDKCFGVMIQRRIEGHWSDQYSLEREPAHSSDILVANHFQASSPTSHFQNHLFVGRFTATGRDGLFDNQLTRRSGSDIQTRVVSGVTNLCTVLADVFDIDPAGHEKAIERIVERSARP